MVGFLIVVCAVLVILKKRNQLAAKSSSGGFDNALFSKDADNVTVSNGNSDVRNVMSEPVVDDSSAC